MDTADKKSPVRYPVIRISLAQEPVLFHVMLSSVQNELLINCVSIYANMHTKIPPGVPVGSDGIFMVGLGCGPCASRHLSDRYRCVYGKAVRYLPCPASVHGYGAGLSQRFE